MYIYIVNTNNISKIWVVCPFGDNLRGLSPIVTTHELIHMIIIQDTREQKALKFKHDFLTGVVREKLDVGDYRGRYENGKESRIIIERKSVGDLFGTLTKGYSRFRKEIERAREDSISLIICVEGSYARIRKGYKHCRRPGKEIQDQLRTIWVKYGVTHVYCVSRVEMANYIVDTFIWCGRKKLWV